MDSAIDLTNLMESAFRPISKFFKGSFLNGDTVSIIPHHNEWADITLNETFFNETFFIDLPYLRVSYFVRLRDGDVSGELLSGFWTGRFLDYEFYNSEIFYDSKCIDADWEDE